MKAFRAVLLSCLFVFAVGCEYAREDAPGDAQGLSTPSEWNCFREKTDMVDKKRPVFSKN